jgi:hypothetical protein
MFGATKHCFLHPNNVWRSQTLFLGTVARGASGRKLRGRLGAYQMNARSNRVSARAPPGLKHRTVTAKSAPPVAQLPTLQ